MKNIQLIFSGQGMGIRFETHAYCEEVEAGNYINMKTFEGLQEGFVSLDAAERETRGGDLFSSLLGTAGKVFKVVGIIDVVIDVTSGIIEGYNYGRSVRQ